MQTQKPPRPIGVTIIAILAILVGAILFIAGLAVVALSGLLASAGLFGLGSLFAGIGLVIAGIFFFFGFIWTLTGWGFLNGKGWARTLGLIFSILSILGNIVYVATGSLTGLVGLVIWGLMIYYLMEKRVKAFFGKGPGITPTTYTTTPPSPRPGISPASMIGSSIAGSFGSGSIGTSSNRFCTNCGATASPGLTKCSNCGAPL